jgi:phosphatidylglycerol:prolipoprotein diacylglycerol transferase
VISVITMPLDPALQIGPLPLHWYGLGYAIAFLVGVRLITPFLQRRGIPPRTTTELVWWNIGAGLLGARLYFDIQQPDLSVFVREPIRIIAVWEGGMAFFGALLACAFTCIVFTYVKKLPLWPVLDAGALFATLPQAIGRVGNIINGDILGPPSTAPWAVRYTSPLTFAPHVGVAYQPAGAYELLVSLLLFGLVLLVLSRHPPDGVAGIFYIAAYSVSQFLLFFARATEPLIIFGLKQAQVTALVILFVLVPALILLRMRYPHIFTVEEPAAGQEPRRERARGLAEEGN